VLSVEERGLSDVSYQLSALSKEIAELSHGRAAGEGNRPRHFLFSGGLQLYGCEQCHSSVKKKFDAFLSNKVASSWRSA